MRSLVGPIGLLASHRLHLSPFVQDLTVRTNNSTIAIQKKFAVPVRVNWRKMKKIIHHYITKILKKHYKYTILARGSTITLIFEL
jgi:hypothetical protein